MEAGLSYLIHQAALPASDQPDQTQTYRAYVSGNRKLGLLWLAEYRVHHLLSLVALRPDSDITALASESGFTSRTSFFRQFRQVTGLTPNQYRNVRKETGK